MTNDRMALGEIVEKSSDVDFLRELLGQALQRLMDIDVQALCQAAYRERSTERANSRNGYRERAWETRAGTLALQVPKLRQGTYFPAFLEPRRGVEKALTAVIQEAYIQGISTRSVDNLMQAFGAKGMSKSEVSRLCQEIDVRVKAFLERDLTGRWPYLWIDATYIRVRQDARIVKVPLIIAVGVDEEGRRGILGMAVKPSEGAIFWKQFLRSLLDRGLSGVKLVISDDHNGIKAAASQCIPGAAWQRCRVHFMRNALAYVTTRERNVVSSMIKTIFAHEDRAQAHRQWRLVADHLRARFSKLAAMMDEAEHDVLAHLGFPKEHWRRLHSTNAIERVNWEIKRRTNVVGIFPNEAAIVRLAGAILLELNDDWELETRYMRKEVIAEVSDNLGPSLPVLAG
jgi:putative transposase